MLSPSRSWHDRCGYQPCTSQDLSGDRGEDKTDDIGILLPLKDVNQEAYFNEIVSSDPAEWTLTGKIWIFFSRSMITTS